MDGKRAANGAHADEPDQKKAKTEGGAAKPALNLEALQKAKLLLEKQKALREKLKKVPALQTAGAAAAAGVQPSAAALAATANPLAPGGLPGAVNAAEVAAKAAKAVEIASKFGVQASLAGVPSLAVAAAAAGMPAAVPGLPSGVRPMLAPPAAAAGMPAAALAAVAAAGVPGVRPVAAPGAGGGPRPLRLDAAGREVDEAGNVIQAVKVPVATSLINMPRQEPVREPSPPPGPRDEDFVDASMAVRSGPGRTRSRGGAFLAPGRGRGRKGALEFVEEGSLQRQAEIMRLKQKYGEADFRKHLPPHLRRPPRGPAGPAEREVVLGSEQQQLAPPSAGPGGELSGANAVPLGVRPVEETEEDKLRKKLPEVAQDPPEVEWWDKLLLEGGAYYTQPQAATGDAQQQPQQQQQADGADGDPQQQQQPGGVGADVDEPMQEDGQQQLQQQQQKGQQQRKVIAEAEDGQEMRLRLGKLTRYVEHPVPLEPPDEGPPPAPQPLKLTKRELKKLRTQRRQAREKEKQELMRQGLLEPPKPKVKISNLMRVLGEEAVLDPTAIEQEVRRQMSERQSAHEDRNLARALTPAERRDKKLKKLFEGDGMGSSSNSSTATLAAVYRVESLAHGQHRFKVDVNAKENHMTGIMLVCPSAFSLVVVEGVPKALKRYHKLMLRRIDWTEAPTAPGGQQGEGEAEEEDEGGPPADKPANSCHLVWEGVLSSNAFKDFIKDEVATQEAARKLLEDRGVAHYWDAAANFDFDAAPLPSAVFER